VAIKGLGDVRYTAKLILEKPEFSLVANHDLADPLAIFAHLLKYDFNPWEKLAQKLGWESQYSKLRRSRIQTFRISDPHPICHGKEFRIDLVMNVQEIHLIVRSGKTPSKLDAKKVNYFRALPRWNDQNDSDGCEWRNLTGGRKDCFQSFMQPTNCLSTYGAYLERILGIITGFASNGSFYTNWSEPTWCASSRFWEEARSWQHSNHPNALLIAEKALDIVIPALTYRAGKMRLYALAEGGEYHYTF